jgi:preprotein translocase subunit YajC
MNIKLSNLFTVAFLTLNTALFAQTDDVAPPDQGFWQTLVMLGIAFLFFYVILWRPEQKRRKAAEAQRNALKKGDRVVAMGIIGTVARVGDQTVIVRMYDGAKVEFYKAAITDILPESGETDKKGHADSEE